MSLPDLIDRSGGLCEFCSSVNGLAESGAILLCLTCRETEGPAPLAHWRCLEGAAWSLEPAVQAAVWKKLGTLDAAWATEIRSSMTLSPEAAALIEATAPADLVHRDANGAILAQGDTVVLTKDLQVKGAGFTAKRGTSVRAISLVADNATQIEGRIEGQRIIILTEFVKKK